MGVLLFFYDGNATTFQTEYLKKYIYVVSKKCFYSQSHIPLKSNSNFNPK